MRAPRRRAPMARCAPSAAVLMALFVAALATIIITGLFYRQFVLLRTIENQQLTSQSRLLLRGALDWESRDPARGRQSLAIRRAKRAVVAASVAELALTSSARPDHWQRWLRSRARWRMHKVGSICATSLITAK